MKITGAVNILDRTNTGRPRITFFCAECSAIMPFLNSYFYQSISPKSEAEIIRNVPWFAQAVQDNDAGVIQPPKNIPRLQDRLCHCTGKPQPARENFGTLSYVIQQAREKNQGSVMPILRRLTNEQLNSPELREALDYRGQAELHQVLEIHKQAVHDEEQAELEQQRQEYLYRKEISDLLSEAGNRAQAAATSHFPIADMKKNGLTAAEAREVSAYRKGAVNDHSAVKELGITIHQLRFLIKEGIVKPSFHRRRSQAEGYMPMFNPAAIPSIRQLLEETPEVRDQIKQTAAQPPLTVSALRQRGWTEEMIQNLMGEPNFTLPNPHYKNSHPMKFYLPTRVEAAESSEGFKIARQRSQSRKRKGEATRSARQSAALAWAQSTGIVLTDPAENIEQLRRMALWRAEPQGRREPEEEQLNSMAIHLLLSEHLYHDTEPPPIPGYAENETNRILHFRAIETIIKRWPQLKGAAMRTMDRATRRQYRRFTGEPNTITKPAPTGQ